MHALKSKSVILIASEVNPKPFIFTSVYSIGLLSLEIDAKIKSSCFCKKIIILYNCTVTVQFIRIMGKES